MSELFRHFTSPAYIWVLGILGDLLVITAVVTAIMDKTIGGFTPVLWVLLGIVCAIGVLFVTLLRVLAKLEHK